MKHLVLLLLLFPIANSIAQEFDIAVINDTDGFVNVRADGSTSSKVIDKLENGFLVAHFGAVGNWIGIEYYRNGEFTTGFVYKDRILSITSFLKIPVKKETNNQLQFKKDSIIIDIKTKIFESKKHTLTYSKSNKNQLIKIDNKELYGTDGGLPNLKYQSIVIKKGNTTISLPKEALDNLYQPNFHLTTIYYNEKTDTFYIYAFNSDGAGGYALVLVVEKGKYKTRFITSTF